MKKFLKIIGALALTIGAISPSYAKWRFSDQVNLANNSLTSYTDQIKQQMSASGGIGPGFYMPLPFRQNDVFVFCKEGPNTQGVDYYWIPTDGIGGYTITNYYAYIYNPQSWVSTAYYLAVCPIGAGPGNWTGPGSGGDWKGNSSGGLLK